jgi:transcription initiation factor TFIIB
LAEANIPLSRCTNCGGTDFIKDYELGELVCERCGYVAEEHIVDHSAEWRAFDEEEREKRDRAGAPLSLMIHDGGLSTTIGRATTQASVSQFSKEQANRIARWQDRVRVSNSTDRNLSHALNVMMKVGDTLNLPRTILESASLVYRRALRNKLVKGRSIHGVVAASVYIACKQFGMARTLEEIAGSCTIAKKEAGRSYRYVAWELSVLSPPTSPEYYVTRFSEQLELPRSVEIFALKLLKAAVDLKLTSGRGPTGLAAAVTYVASLLAGEHKTQREIAEVAKVTEVTIRNRYKELLEKVDITTPI